MPSVTGPYVALGDALLNKKENVMADGITIYFEFRLGQLVAHRSLDLKGIVTCLMHDESCRSTRIAWMDKAGHVDYAVFACCDLVAAEMKS